MSELNYEQQVKIDTDDSIIARIAPSIAIVLPREDAVAVMQVYNAPLHVFNTEDGLRLHVFKTSCQNGCCFHICLDVLVRPAAFDDWFPTTPHKAIGSDPTVGWEMAAAILPRVAARVYDLTGWHVSHPDFTRGLELDGIQIPQMHWQLDPLTAT